MKRRLVHVRELDGIRGIAAIVVFFHHVCFTSISDHGWGPGVTALRSASRFGNTGVDVFFVLSGFLISSLLIEDRESTSYYHDFYWKRALRILPLYVACLLGVLIFVPHSQGYVLLSALFIANFAQVFHVNPSGPFWTLAIEEQFYIVWPGVIRKRSVAAVSRWAVGIGLTVVALRVIAAALGHHNYQLTFFHCDTLAVGAWLACRFERWSRLGFSTLKEKMAWAASLVFAVILIVISAKLPDTYRGEAFSAAADQTATTLLAGALIAFVLVHRGRSYLGIFRSSILTFFGLISYAFYMTHLYVMYLYDHFRGAPVIDDVKGYTLRFATILSVTISVCLISRYALELPASSLRRFVLSPKPRVQ